MAQSTTAFLVPFPKVKMETKNFIPPFLLYAPPLGLLKEPKQGEKESLVDKARRKWQDEHDRAEAKGGIKAKAIDAIDKGMSATKNTRVEFLSRTPEVLASLTIHHPSGVSTDELREQFDLLLRETSKHANQGTVIAGLLLPVTFGVDVLLTPVWPLPGPFLPIDGVYFAASYSASSRAKTIVKKLTDTDDSKGPKLEITFVDDPRLESAHAKLDVFVRNEIKKKETGSLKALVGLRKEGSISEQIEIPSVEDAASVMDLGKMVASTSPEALEAAIERIKAPEKYKIEEEEKYAKKHNVEPPAPLGRSQEVDESAATLALGKDFQAQLERGAKEFIKMIH